MKKGANKHKNNNPWIVIAVIVIIAIIFILYAIKDSQKESLTSDDFKIVSASWKESLDWEKMCSKAGTPDCSEVNYIPPCIEDKKTLSGGYLLDIQMNEDYLSCSIIINGLDRGWRGIEKKNILELAINADYTKDNQITLCCKSDTKKGKVCSTITLKANC
ncbi:MAG: hypothetical protein ABIJ20_03240 [Nanoarchaeota archaeon]|nr:hypothetical protein [Nanoarchaeota archaeon]